MCSERLIRFECIAGMRSINAAVCDRLNVECGWWRARFNFKGDLYEIYRHPKAGTTIKIALYGRDREFHKGDELFDKNHCDVDRYYGRGFNVVLCCCRLMNGFNTNKRRCAFEWELCDFRIDLVSYIIFFGIAKLLNSTAENLC